MRRTLVLLFFCFLLAVPIAAQQPTDTLAGPLTLLDAIRLGRERGVVAALARLTAEVVTPRNRATAAPEYPR